MFKKWEKNNTKMFFYAFDIYSEKIIKIYELGISVLISYYKQLLQVDDEIRNLIINSKINIHYQWNHQLFEAECSLDDYFWFKYSILVYILWVHLKN